MEKDVWEYETAKTMESQELKSLSNGAPKDAAGKLDSDHSIIIVLRVGLI